MLSIKKLELDMKAALRTGNKLELSTVRMLLSEARNVAKEKQEDELSEDELVTVVKRQIKKGNDSIAQYEKALRQELADKEKAEIFILQRYLPPQITDEEIRKIVDITIKELSATSMSEMGKVIGAVMNKVKGSADGQAVSRIVREQIGVQH